MILVTGGAGFIGSNLVAALTDRGLSVAVCDRLGCAEKWRNLAKRRLDDLIPPEALLADLAAGRLAPAAVVHLGAISDTTAVDGDAVVANNFGASRALWTWCAEAGAPYLYASSAATYGDGSQGFEDELDEAYLARLRPLNLYGWSKHLFDRWVAERVASGKPRPPQWAGLKLFNVFGPNEYHKGPQASVVYQLHRQLAEGAPAQLFQSHHPDYPDGGQLRDFVWVEDCVEALLWLLDNRGVSGLFNLGSGKARSFADLARALFAATGRPESIRYVPTPEAIRDKYQYFTQAAMGRLRAAGYDRPFTPLETAVARYVGEFLERDDPYR